MNANRGVKRKRGLVKPHQPKVRWIPLNILFVGLPLKITPVFRFTSPPNKFFPENLYANVFSAAEEKRTNSTLPQKHHSLQEFKRLAKHAKVNETQIIVKKLKSLRSSSDGARTTKHDSTKILQDLEVQLVALKVRLAYAKRKPAFLTIHSLWT